MKRARALSVKARIDELDYATADPGNYALAGEKLATADSRWQELDLTAATDAIEEALLRYNLALARGWELLAGTQRSRAEANKQLADDIKANIAVAEQYDTAKLVWDNAVEAAAGGNNEYAAGLFEQAEELFAVVYQTAADKRSAAEAAMAAARNRQGQSLSTAQEADQTLGLTPENSETIIELEPTTDDSINVEVLEGDAAADGSATTTETGTGEGE